MQQLPSGWAPHFEQVIWHRSNDSGVGTVPRYHSHHQFGLIITVGNDIPGKKQSIRQETQTFYSHKEIIIYKDTKNRVKRKTVIRCGNPFLDFFTQQ